MIRNVKILGLALVAMCAMSALASSVASAASFDATKTPVTLTAAQEETLEHKFTVNFGSVVCHTATFTGTVTTSPATSVRVTPHYTGCLFAGIGAEVKMNGCEYELFASGKVNVICPVGSEITVVAPSIGTVKCTIHVPEQSAVGGKLEKVTYTNVGIPNSQTEEITLNINISKIKYSQTEGTGLGRCPTSDNQENGTYVGKALATGETDNAAKEHVGLLWTA